VADLTQARAIGAKVRLVPILLLKSGRCMKGRNFASLRDTGNPVTAAKVYDAQRVDELVFLDIAANEENRHILFDVVQGVAEQCFMPLTVGGGVRTLEDMRRLLQTGADKVAFNTAAVERPALVEEAARTFGSANVVVSIDARRIAGDRYEVWTHSGRQVTGLEAVEWARRMAEAGAGEILVTSIDREGTMTGYDLELVGAVADAVAVPVIANGGAGTLQHLVEAVTIGHASAVAASSIFHFTDQSPIKARSYMRGAGLHVRAA
jgi:cyclase